MVTCHPPNCPSLAHRHPSAPGAGTQRRHPGSWARHPARAAFSLIELLVSLAILALLASLLAPSLGAARNRTRSVMCLNHLRQLQLGWMSYVEDHHGDLPPNDAAFTNGVWRSTGNSWIGPSNARIDTTSESIGNGLFWRLGYVRPASVYRCPDDLSRIRGSRRARTRSYAMNGNLAGRTNEMQATLRHAGDIPAPDRLMVFLDEHEDSIDDGHFLVWPFPDDRWVNLPAGRHRQMGLWTAADGHVERRRWRHPKSFEPRREYWKRAASDADLADLRDVQSFTLTLDPPPAVPW